MPLHLHVLIYSCVYYILVFSSLITHCQMFVQCNKRLLLLLLYNLYGKFAINHLSFIFAVRFQLAKENLQRLTDSPRFPFPYVALPRLARNGNREAALSASQFNAVLSSGRTI